MMRILVVNPGSTSTKIALFEDDTPVWNESVEYPPETLASFLTPTDQMDLRFRDLSEVLRRRGVEVGSLSAVSGRGGPFKPLEGGTYRITPNVVGDVLQGRVQFNHASLLGVCLADRLVQGTDIPAFFVDPVSVDELEPPARLSGMPELERKSLVHALNVKAAARKVAVLLRKDLSKLRMVVAHLGGGISVCALKDGYIIDVNNAAEGGPFSPERSGTLPVHALVELCFSGRFYEAELRKKIVGQGGLIAHLGTNDAVEIEKRIAAGDGKAERVYRAMAYQIAKEIGAMATVLKCMLDGIVLTGGLARSQMLTGWIQESVGILGSFFVLPGEFEMEALAQGVLRVLRGEERVRSYENR
jgi:butyrate kinase